MEDKIVIDLNKNLLDKNFQFLNNNNECIICKEDLNKNDDLVLINNLCKCYEATKICKECFIKWIKENKECMICRKKFINDNIDIDRVKEHDLAPYINADSVSIEMYEDYPEDIRYLLQTGNFTNIRTFRLWLYKRKIKCLFYIFAYGLIGVFLFSFKMTIEYQKFSNNTNGLII